MNVLIIPEDFFHDQYVLKPIVEAMLKHLDKSAKVAVCQNPRLRGISQALDWQRIEVIIEQYAWKIDLFLLCVDRDCVEERRTKLTHLEKLANAVLPAGQRLFAEHAWQEIEVWVLAGHDNLPTEWQWSEIRDECDPKEVYFIPFAEQRGVLDTPGQGRKVLAEEAAHRYSRIRQICSEDIAALEENLRAWLESPSSD
jgi:hypothetical protein